MTEDRTISAGDRIPITIESDRALEPVSVIGGLTTIFPRNLFAVFFGSGDFLMPILVLAFLLGLNLDFDRQLPAASLMPAADERLVRLPSRGLP